MSVSTVCALIGGLGLQALALWAGEPVKEAPDTWASYRFSEVYSQVIEEDSIVENYTCSITITGRLAGVDISSFNADTVFGLSLGQFGRSWRLGDDPSYYPGKTTATFLDLAPLPGPSEELGRLVISWNPSTLTATLTERDFYLWGQESGLVAFAHYGRVGAFKGSTNASVQLGHWQNSRLVSYSGLGSSLHLPGEPEPLVGVQVSGQSDSTVPTVTILSPSQNARLTSPLATISGRASDNAQVDLVQVGVNDAPFVTAEGTTNWVVRDAPLQVGPNLIKARSVDTSGNVSLVATTRVSYVLSDQVEIQVVGNGSVRTNYNGQFLEINQPYAMTASPANGHRFDRWLVATNWGDGVAVTTAKLAFVMQSNLTITAVFVDTNRPTVTVSNLLANQRISNVVYTVKGSAKDNVGVSQVWYRLNNHDWTLATGTGAWTAGLSLEPGTNVFQVYAEDAAGNHSAITQVKCIYVVSERLVVQTLGQGSLSPNYHNSLLEVGKAYNMTATGKNGHKFVQWIKAVNGASNVVTSARLAFVMESNLTLSVVFTDTNRPTVTVSNLIANQRLSNAVYTVKGAAKDNVGVSQVWYRLNNHDWTLATGTGAWTAGLSLEPGTNVFQVYAEDAAGNQSALKTLSCTFVVFSPLTLTTNGWGSISRIGFTGNMLQVGNRYTVKGVPGASQVLSHWDGTITARTNPLTFTMESNMVLTANFIPDPFLPALGDYIGLFHPADRWGGLTTDVDATNSGFVKLTLTNAGRFAGQLLFQGTNLSFSGVMDTEFQATTSVPRLGKTPLTIQMVLDKDARTIAGSVEATSAWQSYLLARHVATDSSNALAGTFTMLVLGCTADGTCFVGTNQPLGDGAATVTVNRSGLIQMNGSLSDGTPISQKLPIAERGHWPLFVSLYGGRGLLLGWMQFEDYGGLSTVCWQKGTPPPPGQRHYLEGFSSFRVGAVTRYSPPPPGHNALGWTNGTVRISVGNLPERMASDVTILNNRISSQSGSISNLILSVTPSNGVFRGSFYHPAVKRLVSFNGVVVQLDPTFYEMYSGGWFYGTNESGNIRLHPR